MIETHCKCSADLQIRRVWQACSLHDIDFAMLSDT